MRCDEVKNLIMTYIDGNLPDDKTAKLAAHLDSCPLCREAYAEEVEMVAAFGADTSGLAGRNFVNNVMAGINSALETHTVEAAGPKVRPWTMVAACVATVVFVAGFIYGGRLIGIDETHGFGLYLALARGYAGDLFGAIGGMFTGFYDSGVSAYRGTWSSIGMVTSGYIMFIGIITALSLAACAGLIGIYRGRIVEELRT